jgi:hypothetical protein
MDLGSTLPMGLEGEGRSLPWGQNERPTVRVTEVKTAHPEKGGSPWQTRNSWRAD